MVFLVVCQCQVSFFKASINPDEIYQSSWMFHHYEKHLDVTVLGMLEVDSLVNVNVSAKGHSITDFVGPGGFPNISKNASTIIFVGPFMWKSKILITQNGLKIQKPGRPKFGKKVSHVTFNAQYALEKNKIVFYVTDVGIFKLTNHGLMLTHLLPDINIEEVKKYSEAEFLISEHLHKLDLSFVTGNALPFRDLQERTDKKNSTQLFSLVS